MDYKFKKLISPIIFISLFSPLSKSTLADDIDTSSSITSTAITNWGYSNTLTYGQWFTAPEGKTEEPAIYKLFIP